MTAEAFWRFSLAIYSRPGVAEALIGLQNAAGHNVNLVLFGLWLAACGGVALDTDALARARGAIADLDGAVVQPLRRLRRELRDDPDPDLRALRRRVLAVEIAAERRVQARLAAGRPPRAADAGDRAAIAEANLRLILGADLDSPAAEPLRALIAGPGV